jgi:hypothetical protein
LPPAAEVIFEASLVVRDKLLLVFSDIANMSRMFSSVDLHTGIIKENFYLVRRLQIHQLRSNNRPCSASNKQAMLSKQNIGHAQHLERHVSMLPGNISL